MRQHLLATIAACAFTVGLASTVHATRDCNPSTCASVIAECEAANDCATLRGAARASCLNFCRKSTLALCKDDGSICAGTPATTTSTIETSTTTETSTSSTTTTTLECSIEAAACGSCALGGTCRPHCGVAGEPLVCRAQLSEGICATDADCPAGDICTSDSGTCTDCAPGDCICTAPCP